MADRRREWVLGAAGVVAVVLVVILLAPPASQVALDFRLSTLRTTPDGSGAFYETAEALDVPVGRRMTPLVGVEPIRGPLVLLQPVQPLSPAETDSLLAWVEAGGRLILAPAAWSGLHNELGLSLSYADGAGFAVRGSHPWMADVDSIGPVVWTFDVDEGVDPTIVPLAVEADTGGLVVGLVRRGAGEVLAIADGQLLSNDRIAAGGLAPVAIRAAAAWTAAGDTLWFDEYHHGHRGGSPYRALIAVLARGGVGETIAQLLLVAVLALVPAAVRLGAPRADRTESRRSRLEHVDAVGAVYRRAGAADVARRRLIVGFARRIGRDRPLPGEEAVFLERLERNAIAGGGAVAAVAGALSAKAPLDELARRIDEAVLLLSRTS